MSDLDRASLDRTLPEVGSADWDECCDVQAGGTSWTTLVGSLRLLVLVVGSLSLGHRADLFGRKPHVHGFFPVKAREGALPSGCS